MVSSGGGHNSKPRAVHVCLPGPYLARVDSRAAARGIDRSESLRQLIDAGEDASAKAARAHMLNEVNGRLTQIAMAMGTLKNRFQRSDTEAMAQFRIAEVAMRDIASLTGALPT